MLCFISVVAKWAFKAICHRHDILLPRVPTKRKRDMLVTAWVLRSVDDNQISRVLVISHFHRAGSLVASVFPERHHAGGYSHKVLMRILLSGSERAESFFPESGTGSVDWNHAVLPSGVSSPLDASATACKAWCNIVGNSFPRFSARRRIPLQAVALKKYRCGRSPVSKVCDNKHTAASLCHSVVLSVKNAVGEPIPEFPQPSEEGAKRSCVF
jgi:hypothetical protein